MHWRTMDEMKNAPFSSSCPQRLFEAVGRSESTIGFLTVQSQGVEDRVKTRIFMNIIGNVATSSNQATSSRIQHHPTHFTWRYYTPQPPNPPFCKQQRNLQRSNIFQPSNIFQDSTSSNALHMTLLHPPTPPSVYKNDLSGIASRLRVPRSSGEPPALSLYIYYITLNIVWYSVDVSLDEIRIHHQLAQVTLMSSCWVLQSLRTLHAGILQDPERRSPLLCLGNGTHATAWGMVTK